MIISIKPSKCNISDILTCNTFEFRHPTVYGYTTHKNELSLWFMIFFGNYS